MKHLPFLLQYNVFVILVETLGINLIVSGFVLFLFSIVSN